MGSSILVAAFLFVSCPFYTLASDSDVRKGRYYDVFDDQRLTIANVLDASQARDEMLPAFRQNPFGLSNINSAVNPFAVLFNAIPRPFIRNPDVNSRLTNVWSSCQDVNGLSGVCIPATACGKFGGRPSGVCGIATVCCVNTLNRCGGQVTLPNTYWTSPLTVNSGTTCGLTVTLDNNLIEQKTNKICQVRLDFISFTLAQPDTQSVCSTDTFKVGGSTSNVPIICGDNDGQHSKFCYISIVYLNLPSSVSQLQLLFTFGVSTTPRKWNIKISVLPCGSSLLAPGDCLQYFTQASGQVKSFNWMDVAGTATRHLANQDNRICFRSETASRLCVTPCTTTNAATGFSLSLTPQTTTPLDNAGKSQTEIKNCNNDYMIIEDGFDPTAVTTRADRFCGERLNVAATNGNSVTVCSTVKPFGIIFRTNGDELVTPTIDGPAGTTVTANGNLGFCLSYTLR